MLPKKWPINLNEAINFILSSDHKKQVKHDDNAQRKTRTASNSELNNKYICNGITKCQALDRLIDALKFHQINKNIEHTDINKILTFYRVHKYRIINDYHHILDNHLNEDNILKSHHDEQFKLIYDKIVSKNNLSCDISKCIIYARNSRERENDEIMDNKYNDRNIPKYIDLLDSIHCYFIHSVDTGYRILDEFNDDDIKTENDIDDSCYFDKQLLGLRSYLITKRRNMEQFRGSERFEHNKFITQFISATQQKDDKIAKCGKSIKEKDFDYSFGLRYDYWDHKYSDHYDFKKAKVKYSSLKEELVMNTVYSLEKNVFENAFEKAEHLLNTSDVIKSIKCQYNHKDYGYGIEIGRPLHLNHVLSVVLYTDYDTLSYTFSSTFRKLTGKESNKELVSRNIEYGNWCKYLVETVNCYGTTMEQSNVNVLYHGVTFMYFDKFITTFNSPTSTTTKLQIATIFAKNDGIILDLTKYNDNTYSKGLRYFNCSFMSCFGNEDERLFIQPPRGIDYYLKFVGLRNMKTNENYAYFINVLATFEQLLNYRVHTITSKISMDYIDEINDIMNSELDVESNINGQKYPFYVRKLCTKWAYKITQIKLNKDCLQKYAQKFAIWDTNMIGDKTEDNLILYEKLNKIFKKIRRISCGQIGSINASYLASLLSMLKVINKLKYSKLDEIWLRGTKMVFSTLEFTENESLFIKNGWNIKIIQDDNIRIWR